MCTILKFHYMRNTVNEMIWGARNIPQTALLKLMILYT